jgi:outer membrane protein
MPRTTRSTVALLAATGLFMLGSLGFLAGASMLVPTKPAVIASIDLEKIYESLDEQAAADVTLEQLAATMNTSIETRRKELEDLRTELDSFTPGSPAHKTLTSKIEERLVSYNSHVEFNRQKIEARRAELIRRIYDRIKAVLKLMAQENGWNVVFLDDSIPPLESADATRTMQQISARRMLYCDPALDVTDLVVQRLNTEFKQGGGSAGAKP